MQTDEAPPLVSMRQIVKRFGQFVANDQINLDLAAGEIHALLGENGAGKSTLVKILNGLLQPDAGEIYWQGEQVLLKSPRDASEVGISMVFQQFSLFENLTVAENINAAFTEHDTHGFGVRALADRIIEIGEDYDLNLDPNRPVHTLSTGERQRIEIVRALLRHPKLLILDEPTSVLTPQEAEDLFLTLEKLKCGGFVPRRAFYATGGLLRPVTQNQPKRLKWPPSWLAVLYRNCARLLCIKSVISGYMSRPCLFPLKTSTARICTISI